MRSGGKAALALTCAFALALVMPPAAAAAEDPFDDFRIPAHRAFQWRADLSGSANRNAQGYETSEDKGRGASGSARTSGFWLSDSDDRRTLLAADVAGYGSRFRSETRVTSFVFGDETRTQRDAQEFARIEASHRRYPWGTPLGFEMSVFAAANTSQRWERERRTVTRIVGLPGVLSQTDRLSRETWNYDYRVGAGVSLGAGKVRDATAVYDALALEERLRERGVLKHALSSAVRQRIAAVLYLRDSHATVLERPGKTLWSELVAVLDQEGDLDGNLDPVAVIRALEPYATGQEGGAGGFPPRSPILRLRGAFVGLAVQASHFHLIRRDDQAWSSETSVNDTILSSTANRYSQPADVRQDLILFGPRGEYHRPLGTHRQLDASSQFLFFSKDPAHRFLFQSTGSVGWIVADRWVATGYVTHSRDLASEDAGTKAPADIWSVGYGASLTWYIEDRLQLQVGTQGTQFSAHTGHFFGRNDGLYLALGYRLAGRLDAPGLIEPVRIR